MLFLEHKTKITASIDASEGGLCVGSLISPQRLVIEGRLRKDVSRCASTKEIGTDSA